MSNGKIRIIFILIILTNDLTTYVELSAKLKIFGKTYEIRIKVKSSKRYKGTL